MEAIKRCIEQGRLDLISSYIRNLSDINGVLIHEDDCNLNLLHFATSVESNFRDDVINLILTIDELDINKHSGPGNDYFTAAHIAACFGYSTTLKLLILNGADPYLMDKDNNTVWDIASFHNNFHCILVIENALNNYQSLPPPSRKEVEDSVYFSLTALDLEDYNEKTVESLADQSVIHIKTVDNRAITKVEEILSQRSPASPRFRPIKIETPPRQSPSRKSPPIKTPIKTLLRTPKRTPIKTPTKAIPPKKVPTPPKKGPPPRKERKPRITQVQNLNETIITDEDFNVTLVESLKDDSVLPPIDPKLEQLTDQEIRQQLMRLGESPGPISLTTRKVYLRRLDTLKSSTIVTNSPSKQLQLSPFKPLSSYSPYINAILLNRFSFGEAKKLEEQFMVEFFSDPKGPKDFFNYLLLDPRITNSCQQSNNAIDHNPFVEFIKSIFYIGKGKNNRSLMHLYEAAAPAKNNKPISAKVKRITEIWDQGYGVVSFHLPLNMSADEAFARESYMIDAIGIDKLTNIRLGQRKIDSVIWPVAKRLNLGTYFIHKAYKTHTDFGGRQIKRCHMNQRN